MDIIVFQLVDLVEKIRSHHASRSAGAAVGDAAAAGTSDHSSAAGGSSSTSSHHPKPPDAESRNQQEIIRNSPAVKFLTRTDFFSLVQYSDVSINQQCLYTMHLSALHNGIITIIYLKWSINFTVCEWYRL